MAFFNRKKTDPKVLPEIEKYYDAEKRERAGLAWLLAVVSIACVALVLIGAFLGGRWVYRKVSDSDKKVGVSTAETSGDEIAKTNTDKDDTVKPSDTKTPNTSALNDLPKPSIATPKPTTPTPPKPTTLVNTGPAHTLVAFVVSVIGFTGLYNFLLRRELKR